ncbi:hypothetical protein GWK91_11355 [Virgibacillus sp. MSP4-1]|uniref:YveK family protein n=1 Tax=Virgibacillus sp. MSP4-1 TaxID=2700081 RepID=UPI0003A5D5F0|nr:Wzz/FepE/Etk N-terminal domain-containing protein [Virgibacillus sp. MSP4-1]QHS23519.1 hypothetical protein GWK91_11355 [Virgibacillus sp. MSP4-1]
MENEISLREIIETLLKGKWIIAAITAVFVVIAFIYSSFIASPVYEANTSITINNVEPPVGSLAEYVKNGTTRDVFVEKVKSPEVLQETIEELDLKNQSVSALQNRLNITQPENNEFLINLSVEGTNRDKITSILNTVVNKAKLSIEQAMNDHFNSYQKLYAEKMEEEEKQLEEYLKDYKELENTEGLPLLVLFQQNASDSQYVLEANEQLLSELRDLEKETQVEYEQVNEKISQTNERYKQFYSNYSDAKTAKSLDLVDDRINMISEAYAGYNPIAPNKVLNMAFALALGLIVSVFVVFFRFYWANTEEK